MGQERVLVHDPAVNPRQHRSSGLAPFNPAGLSELDTAGHCTLTVDFSRLISLLAFAGHSFSICFALVQRNPTFSHWVFKGNLLRVYRWLGVDGWASGQSAEEESTVAEAGNRVSRCV